MPKPSVATRGFITVREYADIHNESPMTSYRRINAGKVPHVVRNGVIIIPEDFPEKELAELRQQAMASVA